MPLDSRRVQAGARDVSLADEGLALLAEIKRNKNPVPDMIIKNIDREIEKTADEFFEMASELGYFPVLEEKND